MSMEKLLCYTSLLKANKHKKITIQILPGQGAIRSVIGVTFKHEYEKSYLSQVDLISDLLIL